MGNNKEGLNNNIIDSLSPEEQGDLADLVGSFKEEKKPEYQESRKIEKFFKKAKEITHGDVLVSIFNNHTSNEDVEIETVANIKKMRAIAFISSSDAAAMELFYSEDRQLNLLTLTVFRNMDNCLNEDSPEIRIIVSAFKRGSEPDVEIADYRGKKKNFKVGDSHDDLLLEILTEAFQSLKIVIGKNQ